MPVITVLHKLEVPVLAECAMRRRYSIERIADPDDHLNRYLWSKRRNMGAMIIKVDDQSSKLLRALAEKLGGDVTQINEEQCEDFLKMTWTLYCLNANTPNSYGT